MKLISIRKSLLSIIISIILIILIPINNCQSLINTHNNILKISNNNIIYVGGSGLGNYSIIQDAVDNSKNGDIIFVYDDSSPYYENIIINKSITVIGEKRDTTIIDGRNNGDVININAVNVKIINFTIQNSKIHTAGIFINKSNITIKNNIIIFNYRGIMIEKCNNTKINQNKIIYNTICGIGISISNINIIINNNISNNMIYGIITIHSNNNSIKKNIISGNGDDGIVFQYSNDNIITKNTISKSRYYGINLYSNGNKNNIIYKNNFLMNGANARGENSNKWNYIFRGNYWDDYKLKYPNAFRIFIFGFWSIPYEIEGNDSNFDFFPRIKPYKDIKDIFYCNIL